MSDTEISDTEMSDPKRSPPRQLGIFPQFIFESTKTFSMNCGCRKINNSDDQTTEIKQSLLLEHTHHFFNRTRRQIFDIEHNHLLEVRPRITSTAFDIYGLTGKIIVNFQSKFKAVLDT